MTGLQWIGTAWGVATAGVAAAAWASVDPRSQLWGPVLSHGPGADPPRVAVTFDDGPTSGATEAVLAILAAERVPAAFFVIGQNVRRAPELVRQMHEQGHLVGNHTEDHPHLGLFRGRRYWDHQLRATDDAIEQAIGLRPLLFRPPMGVRTPAVIGAARRSQKTVVTWSRRAVDGIPTTSKRITDRLVPRARSGDILLLHDGLEPRGRRDPAATLAALPGVIRDLRGRGFSFVRLDELLGLRPYHGSPQSPERT